MQKSHYFLLMLCKVCTKYKKMELKTFAFGSLQIGVKKPDQSWIRIFSSADKCGQDLPVSILIPSELSEIDPSAVCVSQVCRFHCDIHL